MRPTPAHLIDPIAVWDNLSPERRREIGVTALVFAFGERNAKLRGHADPGDLSAISYGTDRLIRLVSCHPPRRPDLAAISVRACDTCGCTEEFGCEGGCHWVRAFQCSRCAIEPVAA